MQKATLKIILSAWVLLLIPFPLLANGSSIKAIKGFAIIEWSYKKHFLKLEQAIVIDNTETGIFETIGDFGHTLYRLDFGSNSPYQGKKADQFFKKKLKLPLTQAELFSYLLYKLPSDKNDFKTQLNSKGQLTAVEKLKKNKKSLYKIEFADIRKKGPLWYPYQIILTSKKAQMKILWKDIELL